MKYQLKNTNHTNSKKTVSAAVVRLAILTTLWALLNGCAPKVERPIPEKSAISTPAQPADITPTPEPESTIVAWVNGAPVSAVHFKLRMARNRAAVHSYFYNKYDAKDHPDFWTTSYEGEIPIEVLRQRALEQLVRITVKQLFGKEKGVVGDITYPTFLQNLKKENERRRIAVANKEPIYGPVQYSERGYFDYLMSIMDIVLEKMLAQGEFWADDETLRQHYELVKDKLYVQEDDIKIQLITISRRNQETAKAYEAIQNARIELESGVPFEEVAERYNVDCSVKERSFSMRTSRIDSMKRNIIKEKATKLPLGQVSRFFATDDAFNIIKCVERKHYGYKPFEDAKQNIRTIYVREKYQAMIDELAEKAEVKINEEVFNHIQS